MLSRHRTAGFLVITTIALTLVLLPGCKRPPEDVPEPERVVPTQEVRRPIEALDLPQVNIKIGISLTSVPPGLAVTLNTSYWIELTDIHNQSIQYSFIGIPPEQPGPTASTAAEFENRVRESPNGRIVGKGTLETVFGSAHWVSGTYDDDDGPVEDIHLFVPHPSGSGNMVLMSVCPLGAATSDDRLNVMQELLTHVS